MSDTGAVLIWWLLVQILGLIALPLAFRLFHRLPDRGYGVSKPLGLLLTSYLFWLLGVLGLLRNDSGSILLSLVTVAVGSLLYYHSRRSARPPSSASLSPAETAIGDRLPLSSWLRANWKLILITEIIFALSFGGWALYRAHIPRVMTAGGEKFMELAFLNGIRRSETLPPHDPWLSGFAISYYYFGYLMMSVLIRLSGVTTAVGYNVGGALLFALTVTGAFSLVYNLVARGEKRGARDEEREARGERRGAGLAPLAVMVALLGVVLLVLLSNFEGPLEVAHWKGLGSESLWKWLDIADLDQSPPSPEDRQGAETRLVRPHTGLGWGWWWRASRVIFDYDLQDWPNRFNKEADPRPHRRENIDEFPFFSFLQGDIHPHILALPFVMLVLTASLTLFYKGIAERELEHGERRWGRELFLWALIFGGLGFLNTWDLPIQWVIAIAAYTWGRLSNQPTNLRPHIRPILTLALALTIGSLLLYAPFYIGLQSQAGGPLVHVHSSTRLAHFGVMFGPLLLILIAFLAWGCWRARERGALALRTGWWTAIIVLSLALGTLLATALAIPLWSTLQEHLEVIFGLCSFILIAFLAWGCWRAWERGTSALGIGFWSGVILLLLTLGMLLVLHLAVPPSRTVQNLIAPGLESEAPGTIALRYLGMRLSTPWVTLLLAGMIGAAVALLRSAAFNRVTQFSLILVIAGAVITLAPEYVYLKDVFGVRINTIFKFYYQAWVLWAVAATGAVYAMLVAEDGLGSAARRFCGGGLALVVGLGLVYPLLAIPERVDESPEAPTLDGTLYLAREEPADYAAVQWINAHVRGTPVILETSGGAYQYEGRVSAQTGLPTLLGWAGHEHQWRGNTIEQDQRRLVIEELYSTTDAQRTLTLLDEYDITYVYVGPLERREWPAPGLQKFDRLLEIVYDHDGVTIYKRQATPGGRAGE